MGSYNDFRHGRAPQPKAKDNQTIFTQWLNNLPLFMWVCANPRAYRSMKNTSGMRLMALINWIFIILFASIIGWACTSL